MSILLNTADVPAAILAAVEASSLTRWRWDFGDSQNIGNLTVYDTSVIPVGWMWFEPAKCRVLVSRDTVGEFAVSEPLWSFAELVHRLDEPTFRPYDVDNWRVMDEITERLNP